MLHDRGSVEWFDSIKLDLIDWVKALDGFSTAYRNMDKILITSNDFDDEVKSALFTSAVVNYARAFSPNKGPDGQKRTLSKKMISSSSGYSELYHSYLLELRNKIIAHHDSDYVDATLTYEFIKLRLGEAGDFVIYRAGSVVTRTVSDLKDNIKIRELVSHLKSSSEEIFNKISIQIAEYLLAANEFSSNFEASRAKDPRSTTEWGESLRPDFSKPVDLLPVEEVDIPKYLKKPKLIVDAEGHVYRDLALTVAINIERYFVNPNGRGYKLTISQDNEILELIEVQLDM